MNQIERIDLLLRCELGERDDTFAIPGELRRRCVIPDTSKNPGSYANAPVKGL
jgi:hypothetical protein